MKYALDINDSYLRKVLIKKLKEEYDLVPLSDLIYDDGYEIDSNGVQKLKG